MRGKCPAIAAPPAPRQNCADATAGRARLTSVDQRPVTLPYPAGALWRLVSVSNAVPRKENIHLIANALGSTPSSAWLGI